MYTLLVVLIVIAALLMIGVVLIQESKGGGLSSNFSSSNAIMGVRKTTDIVEKATWGCAIFMICLSVLSAHFAPSSTTGSSVIERTAPGNSNTNPNNAPSFGAAQQKQDAAKQAEGAAEPEAAAPANADPQAETSAPAENGAAPATPKQ
ncbi:preprotein translocase subunit SecG [Prevotella sp. HUN102]|uniref:preprotein translocase subunit SecG n=1 Tax=Prevotella sp. HUN102 TaxID=1392486 RepID=UPI0009DD7E63|nr:preprotein translocase subunit SecG [Prevotella sp. HUN102]